MGVEVIIPAAVWDDAHRTAAQWWTASRWKGCGHKVTVAELSERPWSKGRSVNAAIAASTADVIVVADGDCFVSFDAMTEAISLAVEGHWVAPFAWVRRLNVTSTAHTLSLDPVLTDRPARRGLAQDPHSALPGGGIIAASRAVWSTVGGFDPRFADWGGEDYALGCALRTMTGMPAVTMPGDLWHLWHPPQPNVSGESAATSELALRYRYAKFRPDQMTQLLDEWRTDA
jgi:hypothetical protein